MIADVLLRIDGEVELPTTFDFAALTTIDAAHQVRDVSRYDPRRKGDAVTLAGLLALVRPKPTGTYLTLHASADDFHATVPLAAVRQSAMLIYRLNEQPLSISAGGPLRFLIPDPAACHTAEVDECASLKFLDHIEVTDGPGHDNRPTDDEAHADLHRRQETAG